MNAENQFSHIDAQDPVSRMAQLSPEEQAEYNDYLDSLAEPDSPLGDDVSEYADEPSEDVPQDVTDAQADSEWLASAGHGTDEDYGGYSVDAYYEDQTNTGDHE
jgi:hypothetical protein